MKKEIIVRLSQSFEETVHIEQEVEYWMARDLQLLFEYSSWDNFLNVIEKAKTACSNSKLLVISHFREVVKMVNLGSGTQLKKEREQLGGHLASLPSVEPK